jgi:hypothetical protein
MCAIALMPDAQGMAYAANVWLITGKMTSCPHAILVKKRKKPMTALLPIL